MVAGINSPTTIVFHSGATAVSVALWEQSIDDDALIRGLLA